MSKPTDIRIKEAQWNTERIDYRVPMKFGGRVVEDVTLFNVGVQVETRDGRGAIGYGSMPMGNVWAWPSSTVSAEETLKAMLGFGQQVVKQSQSLQTIGHPLELVHELSGCYESIAQDIASSHQLSEPLPVLAQLVAASAVDAAIHDGFGRALNSNSYNLLSNKFVNHDLSHYLTAEFADEYLDQYTLRQPKPAMPLYHLVGALDPVHADELTERIDDELPETLAEWIAADGLDHFKIKLAGDNLDWDVTRVLSVDQVTTDSMKERDAKTWYYSLDFNEKCLDENYVLEFLEAVQKQRPDGYERIQYIEQPTHRDLNRQPQVSMHRVAKLKPVVIDESLTDLESLQTARELGYSGVALKACKGHSEALLMGAAAQKFGMFLCVQDLTCVGFSFLHSSSLSARIPTVTAIEGNGRQYCPAGNAKWINNNPGMFQIDSGRVATAELDQAGLGFKPSSV